MIRPVMIWCVSFFLLGSIQGLSADETIPVPIQLTTAAAAPVLDGRLDDPAWQSARTFTDLITFKPDFGKPMSEATEAFLTYDATHLYVAFRCRDAEPGKVKASMSRRDNIDSDDYVGIVLDSFGDHQRGYLFFVNPLGIQMDGMADADGNGDANFDTIWQTKGVRTGDGYTVEMAIPFKSLRFPFRKNLKMRISFLRWIPRKSEQAITPEFRPEKGSILGQMHEIELENIRYQRPVEILPALTFGQTGLHERGAMNNAKGKVDFSLTGKLGLTSEMTLDATYNPDFSQVEADASQIDVNLRYALFYSEKRPFFLEGMEMFAFGGRLEQYPLGAVVHTRTIVDPLLGFKLSGKMGAANMGSLIFAIDEFPGDQARLAGDDDLAGRNAYFTIYRHKYLLKGDSYIGGFYTGRDFAGSYNRLLGGDGRIRLGKTSFFEFNAFHSFSKDREAVEDSQGNSLSLRYLFQTRNWYLETGYIDIGKDFRTDVGYLTRTGIRTIPFFVMRSLYPKSKVFQRVDAFYWSAHSWDTPSGLFETANVFCLRTNLPRMTQLRIDATLGTEVFAGRRFDSSFWRVQGSSQVLKQLYAYVYFRQGNSIYYDPEAPYAGRSRSVTGGLTYQPSDQWNINLDLYNASFRRADDGSEVYDYTILRNRTVFQLNKYLFFRAIVEYNFFRKKLNTDFLASFTYIPGTVIHFGYGSIHEKLRWNGSEYETGDSLLQTQRSLFFKASYNWRF